MKKKSKRDKLSEELERVNFINKGLLLAGFLAEKVFNVYKEVYFDCKDPEELQLKDLYCAEHFMEEALKTDKNFKIIGNNKDDKGFIIGAALLYVADARATKVEICENMKNSL
jgi:hypothetical protein